MTKEQLYAKWEFSSYWKADLEAVIATEIAKVQENKPQPAPFDKERFEAMFRAVVANGGHELDHKEAIELTEEALAQLDAYYASKEGGENE